MNNKAIRPPVTWYGGKGQMAKKIIEQFPEHKIYLEPFGGAASVLLNKIPSPVEMYNDLNHSIVRLFRVLRECPEELLSKLKLMPYSQEEFLNAVAQHKNGDIEKRSDVDAALFDYVRWRQSFGGLGTHWSFAKAFSRAKKAQGVSAWQSSIDQLPKVVERLRDVQICCEPALKFIKRFDHKDALIYCDPPYLHSTRRKGKDNVYGDLEMSKKQHRELGEVLNNCEAQVLLSGYPSKMYDRLYAGWGLVEFDRPNYASPNSTRRRMTECLWSNF